MDCSALELCCILVHTAQTAAQTKLSTVLTAWLHWYGRLDLETAIQVCPCPCTIFPIVFYCPASESGWRISFNKLGTTYQAISHLLTLAFMSPYPVACHQDRGTYQH